MEVLTNWSATSITTQFEAQTGIWTNWSRGRVFGATLTLSRQDGNLLIAFTAFFISMVAIRFWRIVCFTLHRCYSSPQENDVFHHQRQVVLRNSPNPESGLWSFGQLYWAWYRSASCGLLRALPGLICAVVSLVAFTVASGFSPRISAGVSDEVLIKSDNSGFVTVFSENVYKNSTTFETVTAFESQRSSSAANYARQCYAANSSDAFDCASGYFITSRLPTDIDTQAPCPFAAGICRSASGNLRLDTGYLDSHNHLGINAPPSERILYRQVLQCAPLNTNGFRNDVTSYDEATGITMNYTRYYYGSAIRQFAGNVTVVNYTYETRSLFLQYHDQDENFQRNNGKTYQLVPIIATMLNGSLVNEYSNFYPSQAISRTDSDLTIFFLSGNGVLFAQPNDDPWYRGNVPGSLFAVNVADVTATAYEPEEAASPLGCIQQYQICNPSLPADRQCGPLASVFDAAFGAAPLFGLTGDAAIAPIFGPSKGEFYNTIIGHDGPSSRFLWFLWGVLTLDLMVQNFGSQSLVSAEGLTQGFQTNQLPSNQWQIDVVHWWATKLAAIQSAAPSVAQGSQGEALQAVKFPPLDWWQKKMCNSQKVRSTAYSSFSVFALVFIFITGTLIILASYVLEPVFACLGRRRTCKPYKLLEWQTGETLQLQRLAYQGLAGRGTWSRLTDSIPLAAGDELLEPLALNHERGGPKPVAIPSSNEKEELATATAKLTRTQTSASDGSIAVDATHGNPSFGSTNETPESPVHQ